MDSGDLQVIVQAFLECMYRLSVYPGSAKIIGKIPKPLPPTNRSSQIIFGGYSAFAFLQRFVEFWRTLPQILERFVGGKGESRTQIILAEPRYMRDVVNLKGERGKYEGCQR